jgi:hypothetical protein
MTQGYIAQIEAGTAPLDKRSTQLALAKALQVSLADLTGQPYDPTTLEHVAATRHLPELRAALAELAFGSTGTPADGPTDLAAAVRDVTKLHNASSTALGGCGMRWRARISAGWTPVRRTGSVSVSPWPATALTGSGWTALTGSCGARRIPARLAHSHRYADESTGGVVAGTPARATTIAGSIRRVASGVVGLSHG